MKSEFIELYANYHTHTARCGHADGTDREYVEQAVKAGIRVLGFSDHTPMVYATPGYYPSYKMKPEAAAGYFDSLLALKEEFRDVIGIHIGLETEYYPETWDAYRKMMAVYPVEYMILGQHFLYKEENGDCIFNPSDSVERLKSYYKNLLEGYDTGLFLYIAHPDALRFTGEKSAYLQYTTDFLREIKKRNAVLGFNRLGWADKRHYPNPVFWALAGEIGVSGIIEADAHSPLVFADGKSIAEMRAFAADVGVELTETLPLPQNYPSLLK